MSKGRGAEEMNAMLGCKERLRWRAACRWQRKSSLVL